MPQKTVTLEDQVYWELTTNLAKGRQSAFVNEAVKDALIQCGWEGSAMVKYAQGGLEAARAEIRRISAVNHPNQENLTNIEWMEKQKEVKE